MDNRRHCCDRHRLAGPTMIKAVANGCSGGRSIRRRIGPSGSSSASSSSSPSGCSDSSDSGSGQSRGNLDICGHCGATETLVRRRREIVLILRSDHLFA